MNKVILIGRIGKDPEMNYFESGTVKTRLTLAVDRFLGKDKEKATDWFDLEAWGKLAETMGEYCRKGGQIAVEGNLKQETWTDTATQQKRSKLIVQVENMKLLGSKPEGEGAGSSGGSGKPAGKPAADDKGSW